MIQNINRRVVAEFLAIAAVLCAIGYFLHCQISSRLDDSLEESVLRHINTVSHMINHDLGKELQEMHITARMIEHGQLSLESIETLSRALKSDLYSFGVVRSDGSLVKGAALREENFKDIEEAFNGEDVINYGGSRGLIFAVPVNVGGETCALYKLHAEKNIPALFDIISYDGLGRITIENTSHDVIELTKSKNDELYNELYLQDDFREKFFNEVALKLLYQDRAVSHFEYKGEEFLGFGASVYNNKLYLFGIVTRDAIAAGMDLLHIGMIIGMTAFMLILTGFARAAVKSAENKELRVEKTAALQASKTKSEFLSNMSHEIRTPINAILGMNEMILRECTDAQILEYSENVKNASNNLLGIVNDILDFSKIEAGKMEIIPVEYELSSLLNDLVNMIHKRAEDKGLKFIVNADKNLPTILYGDEIRIKQVVTNILINAVKYTERGSITMTVESVQRSADKITIKFSVRDTGIGIKQEDIQKLFSAFERIEEKRNRTIEGTGLGMNITKKLLNMMGTNLRVESVYGEGSNFWFEIEQKIISAEPIGDFEESFRNSLRQHKVYHEKFTAPDAKILVVDDTPMNLTVVKGLLKQTKIQIDTAESGFECLNLVLKNRYDIIFLDHRMPEMDGIETLQEMKKLPENFNGSVPVISLTANAISGAREQYLAAGFKDYLTKPINSVKLEEMLMKYLPAEKIQAASETPAPAEDLNLPDWLKKVDGLDTKEGVTHCGDADLYVEALKVFVNSVSRGADEIQSYFDAGDWKLYTTKVHALKSSARVIGAVELSEKARHLEEAGNSGNVDEIQQDTAPLLELYRSYAEKLSPLVEVEADDSDKPLIEPDALEEAYEAMREAAAGFDFDTLEFVLQNLEEYRLPEDESARYMEIKAAAENLDWEKINQLLK